MTTAAYQPSAAAPTTGWRVVPPRYRELELAQLAATQHGLFTFAQARQLGIARATVTRRVKEGRWEALRRGVYCVTGSAKTRRRDVLAAVLAAGDSAVARRFTAAALHGLHDLWERKGLFEVAVPENARRRAAGVSIRRTRRLGRTTFVDGIPVSSVLDTYLDVADVVSEKDLEGSIMDAVRRTLLDPDDLAQVVNDLRGSGRKGFAKLRRIVAAGTYRQAHDSVLEARVQQLVAELKLAGFQPNQDVEIDGRLVGNFDLVCEELKIVIECNGRTHLTREQRALDRTRTQALRAGGYILLTVRWRQTLGTADRLKLRIERAIRVAKGRRRIFPVPKPTRRVPLPPNWDGPPSLQQPRGNRHQVVGDRHRPQAAGRVEQRAQADPEQVRPRR